MDHRLGAFDLLQQAVDEHVPHPVKVAQVTQPMTERGAPLGAARYENGLYQRATAVEVERARQGAAHSIWKVGELHDGGPDIV